MNLFSMVSVGCGILLLPFLFTPSTTTQGDGNRYIGSQACKNCHAGADKGEAWDKWSKSPHAKAFETLGTPAAKEAGKKAGVEDPQKSEKCLVCHVTAYGKGEKEIKKGFKNENGVQCESCHGPGEKHFKARMAAAGNPKPVDKDEIHVARDVETCKTCHNEKSPTYKPFCLKERMAKIEHLDARKNRKEDELKKIRETDAPNCEVCSKKDKK